MLLLLNKHRDPSFFFQNLSFFGINNVVSSISQLFVPHFVMSAFTRIYLQRIIIRELKHEDFSRRRRGEVREGLGLTSSFSSQILLLSTGASRLGVLHFQILAYLIPLSLLWHVLKSFVRFFSYYDASLFSDEDYIILYELLSSRIQILLTKAIVSTWMK